MSRPSAARTSFEAEALGALDVVHRFAFHLTGNAADSEDLVQETYQRAFAKQRQYTLGTNCAAWLCTICRNVFLRDRAREQRETARSDPDLEALAATAVFVAAQGAGLDEHAFEMPDFGDALKDALQKLSEEFRSAVVLVDIEDMSYQDAAATLKIPLGTLRSRLFRGRRLLQEELLDFAVDAGLVPARSRRGV